MENATVNQDRNLVGRIGALLVIVVAVVGLGRVCGKSAGYCPIMIGGGHSCSGVSEPAPAAPAPSK